jgi:predicted outer membrane repeat protein
LDNCTFLQNLAGDPTSYAGSGAAIQVDTNQRPDDSPVTKKLKVKNTLFQENFAASTGGAIKSNGGWIEVEDTTFLFNAAGMEGGAMFLYGMADKKSKVSVTNSLFEENVADTFNAEGTAIYSRHYAHVTVTDSTFLNNAPSHDWEESAEDENFFGVTVWHSSYKFSGGPEGDTANGSPWMVEESASSISLIRCGAASGGERG